MPKLLTNHFLRFWYGKINREFYRGRLPEAVVEFHRTQKGDIGNTWFIQVSGRFRGATLSEFRREEDRLVNGKRLYRPARTVPVIAVAPWLRQHAHYAFMVLAHEIVHVAHRTAKCASNARTREGRRQFSQWVAEIIVRFYPEAL